VAQMAQAQPIRLQLMPVAQRLSYGFNLGKTDVLRPAPERQGIGL